MALLYDARLRALDSSGNPLSGATLTIMEAGTSNPASIFRDVALATPMSNPTEGVDVSDAAGWFPQIYAASGLRVDITLKNSAGTTIQPYTNVDFVSPGGVTTVAGLSGVVSAAALKAAVSLDNVQNLAVAGRQMLWVPATAMTSRTTNGPSAGVGETTTNKVMRRTYDFDASTIEYVQFAVNMPSSWDEGTITFVPIWSHASTATNFKVSWALQAVAMSDADALDAAFGAAQTSNDTGGATDTVYAGPESSAITIAGTPAANDVVTFQLSRQATDATNDTLAVDARLHGARVYFTTNAAVES